MWQSIARVAGLPCIVRSLFLSRLSPMTRAVLSSSHELGEAPLRSDFGDHGAGRQQPARSDWRVSTGPSKWTDSSAPRLPLEKRAALTPCQVDRVAYRCSLIYLL